jgi:murein DD-endopeptidase MepM/ murein hydrolase activator NlpD
LKNKKTLSNWLTTKYLLIVRNEENLSEKSPFSFTYAKLIVFSFALFTVLLILSLYLSRTILSQWFDPRHATLEANKQLLQLSLQIDSLSYEVARKEMFINTFKSILLEDFEGIDSAEASNPQIMSNVSNVPEDELMPIDSLIRKEFEESGEEYLGLNIQYNQELQEIFFFTPIAGIVTGPFDLPEAHYGIDIVAKTDEPVKSIADGTVIMADWTQDSGYVIAVQHRNNLISVYKHNAALLKKVGSFVSAGEIIAIIGNTGELTTGPHLHFEIWYNGTPVNPEDFVSF